MREGIDMRRLRRIALACVIAVAAVAAGAVVLSRHWFAAVDRQPAPPRIAGPALEARPRADLQDYQRAKQQLLHSYAWVDARHGIARIPLEQAMQALAAQGGAPAAPEGP